jgi:mono/diheme cytochrome c family protein
MKTRVFAIVAVAALGAGCNKKKPEEGLEPPVPSGSAGGGVGNEGSAKPEPPKPDPKLVERGAYLSNLLGCDTCHTPMGQAGPDMTRRFGGGFEIKEAFGTMRMPNISQDKKTGIGNWTDEQIARSIRQGIDDEGKQLYPIMPYLSYNRLTDDDTKALVAFMRSVPPVENEVAPNKDLKLPQPVAPKPANEPDVVADPVKHGEYLVTLMHCGSCHTPAGKDGAPDMTRQFAGGTEMEMPMLGTGKLYASNITSDPATGIGKWTPDDIITAVKAAKRPDKTSIQGPMQFYVPGWSQMTDADAKAMAAFVKQIPPIKNKVPKSTFKPKPAPAAGTGSGSGAGSAAGSTGTGSGAGSGTGGAAASGSGAGSGSKPTATMTGSAGSAAGSATK